MKYFSNEQIQESLRVLAPFNSFFCISFLVLKKGAVPVGSTKRFSLDAETRDFLNLHFRVHPNSSQYFRVMRQGNKSKDWVSPRYASSGLQAVNTQTFRDALLHERYDNAWGWAEDYVKQLTGKLPRGGRRIPLFHLAVWLYKYEEWEDDALGSDVVDRFIGDYHLTASEIESLFHTIVDSSLLDQHLFQDEPVKWYELLAPYSRPSDVPAESSGILTYLETASLGPAESLVFDPCRRLNLITGDNGLGKTFLLDLAWWALTRDWAHLRATPFKFSPTKKPQIKFVVEGAEENTPVLAEFDKGDWTLSSTGTTLSGLVVYARVDGSFAIWDPANVLLAQTSLGHWPGIKFSRDEVWDGKPGQIEGLIRDLVRWQRRPDRYPAYSTFLSVLKRIYPPDLGEVSVSEPVRIPNDPREIPSLKHPYGEVPILFESAGVRRMITLAYLLVWVWEEHKVHSSLQGRQYERQMVVLLDESEAHLHPKWQRVILPGLLAIAGQLHSEMSVQWLVTSHSPLVLASVEGIWDAETDRLFHLDMNQLGKVSFSQVDFEKRGTIDSWLASDLFELREPGSADRESAIQRAIQIQQGDNAEKEEVERVTAELKRYLGAEDPFWIRWIFYAEAFGVLV